MSSSWLDLGTQSSNIGYPRILGQPFIKKYRISISILQLKIWNIKFSKPLPFLKLISPIANDPLLCCTFTKCISFDSPSSCINTSPRFSIENFLGSFPQFHINAVIIFMIHDTLCDLIATFNPNCKGLFRPIIYAFFIYIYKKLIKFSS